MIPYIIRSNALSLFPMGEAPITIDASHINFNAVVEALSSGDFDGALEMARVKAFVNKVSGGDVEVNDDGVFYKGARVTGYLANKLMQFLEEGLPLQHYCLFMSNLMANPSATSIAELYLFLEAGNLPITEDGCFLAYKAVRSDFKDKHTGTIDNSPGAPIKRLERNQVDDNRERTCSFGYHAAAYEYAKNFLGASGDRMVAVKINPADVVSVPSDYNNQKLRCTFYTIEYEIPGALDTLTGRAMAPDNDPEFNAAEDWWSSADEDGWELSDDDYI